MEQHLFSARLREEAVRANSGAVLWPPPMEHQGIVFTPHPPFMFPMDTLTPTERVPRRRESGHELTSPVSSARCRSVEIPAIHPRALTPDQGISSSKPVNQQRSTSLTDVHSWVASTSGERRTSPSRPQAAIAAPDTDQVKSFERFNALMNAAAGARPMVDSIRETQRARDSVKIGEAERSHPHFTRQSCVVTNTAVLHVSSGPKDGSGPQAHGISSGLAPPQPPPLLSITGAQAPRSEGVSNPRLAETISIGRMGLREDSAKVLNPREMIGSMDPVHSATATFPPNPKEQQPPPLVRDAPPTGLKRTPPSRDIGLLGRPNQDLLPCGCKSTEMCKHQLYSQEVPYVQQVDARDRREVEHKQSSIESSSRKSIFRPWTENITKDSAKPPSPLKTVSPPIQLKHTGSSLHSHHSQKRLSGSPGGGGRTPSPSVISHSYSQQPGVLISNPHPSSQELGEVIPRPEPHTRSSHRKDDVLSQERGPRSVLVPQEVTARPSFTSQCLTPQCGSITSYLQRPSDSSSVLHPLPHSVPPRNKSPLPQQSRRAPSSTQPINSSTSHNSREPSIIKSPYTPPLSGVPPTTPQGTQPTPPVSRFSHLAGAVHPSSVVLGMTSAPHPLNLLPHLLPNESGIQEPRGPPSTLIQSRTTHPTPFPSGLSSHYAALPPDLLHSGNISHLTRDGVRLPQPYERFRSSPEHSPDIVEHSRKFFKQSHVPAEPARADYSRPVVSKSASPEPQAASPGSQSVGLRTATTGRGVVTPPPLVSNTVRPKSPFIEQAELHQSSFDAPVDIQRHVNPSYGKKTAGVVSSESRKDMTKSHASSPGKEGIFYNQTLFLIIACKKSLAGFTTFRGFVKFFTSSNINFNMFPSLDAGKLSPSAEMNTVLEHSSSRMATSSTLIRDVGHHTIESDVARHPRDVTSHPREVDIYPDEETCESREDSRSFAESSSVGFESPDDEDHELRMRFFPPDDISDSGGDGLYEIRDSHPRSESEGDEARDEGDNVKEAPERHASDDEFSNADETCIPTDSTYIAYSERSTDGSVRIRHDYDSLADVVDSTVSDFPDFEQPSEDGECEERKHGETRGDGNNTANFSQDESLQSANNNVVSRRFVTEQSIAGEASDSWKGTGGETDRRFGESALNDDIRHPGDTRLMSLQNVSGNEGDDDATEDEAGYSGVGGASEVVSSDRDKVVDTRTSEVDSSEVMEKVDRGDLSGSTSNVVDVKDDSTVMNSTISVDTRVQVDDTASGTEAPLERIEDTSVYDEDDVIHDGVSEGAQDIVAHDQFSKLKDNLEPDVTGVVEDKQEDVGQMSDGTESLHSADNVLPHTETEGHVIAADSRDSVNSRTVITTTDTRNLSNDSARAKNAEDACTTEEAVTTTEDASDVDSEEESNVQSAIDDVVDTSGNDNIPSNVFIERGSEDVKDVSSSSDTRRKVELSDDVKDIFNPDILEAREIESSTKDEGSGDATDSVDSSTDTHADDTQKDSPCFADDAATVNQCAGGEDLATLSSETEKNSEEHVTSSNEYVKEGDERVISGDEQMVDGGEHISDQPKHMDDQDEHVTSGEERVDSQTTRNQNDMKEEGNEVENNTVETEEDRSGETKEALGDVITDAGLDYLRNPVVRNVDDSILGNQDKHEGKEVQGGSKKGVKEGSGGSPTIESTSSPGQENIFIESSSWEGPASSSNHDTQEGQNVSTTGSSVNDSPRGDGIMEETCTNHGIHGEQSSPEISEDITSTVGETQKQVTSKHDAADISSTLDDRYRETSPPEPDNGDAMRRLCVSTSSSVVEQRDDVASSSGVTMQPDDVVTDSDVPRILDVSSSDTSGSLKNGNEAESRSSLMALPDSAEDVNQGEMPTNSSEMDYLDSAENATEPISPVSCTGVDLPDSAHLLDRLPSDSNDLRDQDLSRFSRRLSEDSTSHSDEPSTTNFHEWTTSVSVAGNHKNVCGNEAESFTRFAEGEVGIERISEGDSLNEKDNFVDSSTVSPVSFTDDVIPADANVDVAGHLGSNKDRTRNPCLDTVGTTGYLEENTETADTTGNLGISRDNVTFATGNIMGTTGYLGVNRDSAESASENIVDTTEYLGSNKDNSTSMSDGSVGTTGYFGMNVDRSASLSAPEDTVGTSMGITSSCKYDIAVEAISSDEELEEGEIAETPEVAPVDDATPCDVSPEHAITSSSGSYPPLDTIPISPPADSDEPSSSFLDFATYTFSPTQHTGSSTQHTGPSRVSHSVFPFSALNVPSAPNSNCSSPVAVRFSSGCNTPITYQQADSTPIRFQPADSSSLLTPQYEPLSDDESSESCETSDRRNSSSRDTDSS